MVKLFVCLLRSKICSYFEFTDIWNFSTKPASVLWGNSFGQFKAHQPWNWRSKRNEGNLIKCSQDSPEWPGYDTVGFWVQTCKSPPPHRKRQTICSVSLCLFVVVLHHCCLFEATLCLFVNVLNPWHVFEATIHLFVDVLYLFTFSLSDDTLYLLVLICGFTCLCRCFCISMWLFCIYL